MTEVANTTTNYLSPGSICWAAFLAMGACLENSPNASLTDITIPRQHRPFGHPTDEQTARLILKYAEQFADYDQLILEHSGTTWWIHISCRINYRLNRHKVIKNEE